MHLQQLQPRYQPLYGMKEIMKFPIQLRFPPCEDGKDVLYYMLMLQSTPYLKGEPLMELIYKILGVASAVAEEAGAAADAAATEMTGGQMAIATLLQLFPLIILFALMYFMMIRPERKRKKKEKAMLDALKRGDRICTIGGIYGTIMDIKDDTITLAVGRDNMSMVVARWSIRSVEDVTIENESESLN